MNFIKRLLKSNPSNLRYATKVLPNYSSIWEHSIKRNYFDSKVLGITRFVKVRTMFEQKNLHEFNAIKEKFAKLVATDESRSNELSLDSKELFLYICLCTTDDEIDLVIKLMKRSNTLKYDENNLEAWLMRLLYYLNKMDKALELISNPKFDFLFQSHVSLTIFYNKLLIDKRYETVIEVFRKRFISSNKHINGQDVLVLNHWSLIFEALLRINSDESFDLTKTFLDYIEKTNTEIYYSTIAACFLLSIRRDPNFALEILDRFFKGKRHTLSLNLRIIAYCHLNERSKAMSCAAEILQTKKSKDNELRGCFLYTTEKMLTKFCSNLPEYDNSMSEAKRKDRLLELNLLQYCIHPTNPMYRELEQNESKYIKYH